MQEPAILSSQAIHKEAAKSGDHGRSREMQELAILSSQANHKRQQNVESSRDRGMQEPAIPSIQAKHKEAANSGDHNSSRGMQEPAIHEEGGTALPIPVQL
ncbi:hypothetical protein DPMN_061812 [Dreissena polymorpha]|uniref:Uncharacterized protein n=1 Tax=Dreissena polymorpha TaxID=45954 RepID=A0A9D4HIR1_DREPO|nr:hypothetical protein DPMN_061812 [Dreissena polymorpha]